MKLTEDTGGNALDELSRVSRKITVIEHGSSEPELCAGAVSGCENQASSNQMLSKVEAKRGSLSTNIVANVIGMLTSLSTSIFLVPFLVRNLGVEVYGLIPLANYFIQYIKLISQAINAAVGRYLTVAIEDKDIDGVKHIFNTAFWSNVSIAFLLSLISVPVIAFLDKLINLPTGTQWSARFLFIFVFAGFFITLVSSVFTVSSWCLNRFDLLRALDIVRQVSYLVLVLLFFSLFHANLILVGVAMFASVAIRSTLSFFISRDLLPNLEISPKHFHRSSLNKLLSTGGWVSINKIGALLYLNVDLFVINRFLGASAAGRYASVLQWSTVIRMLGAAVSPAFGPPFVSLFARNDLKGLALHARRSVKILGLMMALPVGLVSGFSAPLLTLWLGDGFADLSTLVVILTFHLCVNVAVYPLFELQMAANKVRLPGIVTCVMGVVNFGLILLSATKTNWGLYGVAAAGAVMLTLKNFLFTPIFGARIIGQPWNAFVKELLKSIAATCGVLAVSRSIRVFAEIDTWFELILLGFAISVAYCIVIWSTLSKSDQDFIIVQLRQLLKKVEIVYVRE